MSEKAPAGIDLTDVPPVAGEDIALAIGVMVRAERALMLVRGATRADRAEIEALFWQEFSGETAVGVATLVRLWSFVEACQSRRLRSLLMRRGYQILGPAASAAASLRLNLHWGFNPQRLIWAIGPEQPVSMALRNRNSPVTADEIGMAA